MNHLMKEHGGFEHNRQSLRIVTVLEDRYPNFPGLNLTYEVREGLAKHQTTYDQPNAQASIKKKGHATLEAQIVNLADEIAYSNHDLDDGLRSGLINLKQLEAVELWQEHFSKNVSGPEKIRIRQTIKAIINAYVSDLVTQVEENVRLAGIKTLTDIRVCKQKLVSYSSSFEMKNRQLKGFLREQMYKHYHVERMADKAKRILEGLYTTYLKNPKILPPEIREQMKQESSERVICDYIAGMTDRFALEEFKKLFDPAERV